MSWSCDCGHLKKNWIDGSKIVVCPKCHGSLKQFNQMSLESFVAFKDEGVLGERQSQVLNAIKKLGSPNNREISDLLKLPINSVTPRVKELRDEGLVVGCGLKFDTITNRNTNAWRCK